MGACGIDCTTCGCATGGGARRRPAKPIDDPFAEAGDPSATPVATLSREVAALFAAAGVPSPTSDAAQLLAHLLGQPVVTAGPVTPRAREEVLVAAARRAEREPLQHIIGEAAFRYLDLHVGPGVFVPRPETESVVSAGLQALPPDGPAVVVDLGAGSGAICLAIATERPHTTVYAVELDAGAVPWLTQNVMRHAAKLREHGSQIVVVLGDAGAVSRADQPLARLNGSVDLVISNPPYIPDAAVPRDPEVRDHDPSLALYGGVDGLDQVRRWLDTAADLLAPGGALVLEHGDLQGDDDGVPGILARHEDLGTSGPVWLSVSDHADLNGRPRYATARRT